MSCNVIKRATVLLTEASHEKDARFSNHPKYGGSRCFETTELTDRHDVTRRPASSSTLVIQNDILTAYNVE